MKQSLAAAELNLQITTAERRVLELKRKDVERDLAASTAGRDGAAREASAARADLSARLAALYRLGRLGYLRTVAAADSGRSFFRGLQVLTHLARRDADLLSRNEAALASLSLREKELDASRRELASLLADTRRKEGELAAARARKASALVALNATTRETQAAVTTLEDKSERLASLLSLLEEHGRTLPAGAASIRKFQGVLDWPLKGKVAVPFGRIANPKFPKTFLRSNGWTLDAATGSDVRAVFGGEVVYSQWLKGYGNLVVLDHGDAVFTLYGRLAPGTIARGQHVALGDRVGVLGDTPEDEVAGLYFEIRESRSSVDPAKWLK